MSNTITISSAYHHKKHPFIDFPLRLHFWVILSHFRAVQSRSKAGVPVSSSPGRCRGGPAGLESGGPALRLRQRLRLRVGQEERRAAGPGAGEPLGSQWGKLMKTGNLGDLRLLGVFFWQNKKIQKKSGFLEDLEGSCVFSYKETNTKLIQRKWISYDHSES